MKEIPLRKIIYLAINTILFIFSLWHLPNVFQRPMAPFYLTTIGDSLVVEEIIDHQSCGDLQLGDRVITWAGQELIIPESIEFLAELSEIGNQIEITFQRAAEIHTTAITILPYYSSYRYVIIIFFVGFITWCVGIFILLKGPPEISTTILHWTMVALAVSVVMTSGTIRSHDLYVYLSRIVFLIFYMITITGFFFFSTMFPIPKPGSLRTKILIIFGPMSVLIFYMIYHHIRAIHFLSIKDFVIFQSAFDIFHISLYLFFAGAIFNFLHTYNELQNEQERSRIKLILGGVIIGTIPFLILTILPQLSDKSSIVREEFTIIFFLVIPLTFTLAILKYRFLNIDAIINRTVVYILLTILIGSIYIVTVLLVTSAIGGETVFDQHLFILLVTLLVAIIFNPLRNRIQKMIDEFIFTARTNFSKAVKEISQQFHQTLSSDELFKCLINTLQQSVHAKNMAVYSNNRGLFKMEAATENVTLDSLPLSESESKNLSHTGRIYSIPKRVITYSGNIDYSQTNLLNKTDFDLCIPLISDSKQLLGLFFCSPLHARFIEEELDLLLTGCTQASVILDRLLLQERIIVEREEKKRLKDLSTLKSYFVSSVSHEFQTPLTSIKMFAELLQENQSISPDIKKDYLETIEGESERLSRMVKNVLDFSKIERGIKEYQFTLVDLKGLIQDVLRIMNYQLKQHAFKIELALSQQNVTIKADADALIAAFTNLISNAIKYSKENKYIHISTIPEGNNIKICIRDKGIGISKKDQKHIFDSFYRAKDEETKAVGGVGLGLALVKHVVQAHRGKIEVDSIPDKGSTFCIILPMEAKHATNSDNRR
jgi:signal transduction histidine kinase